MTQFLASVRNASEAEIALRAKVDVIDFKDPAHGALGAVAHDELVKAVGRLGGRVQTSATIGDLPMQPRPLSEAMTAVAATGVDYVKFGVFPKGALDAEEGAFSENDAEACLAALKPELGKAKLIGVLFADALPAFDALAALRRAGAFGFMLDTCRKQDGSLLDHLHLPSLRRFIAEGHAQGMIVGLAGSLRACHVPVLLSLKPDLLGFRGALCAGRSRIAALDPDAIARIRALIPEQGPAAPLSDARPSPIC